jgi:hypothetical protein
MSSGIMPIACPIPYVPYLMANEQTAPPEYPQGRFLKTKFTPEEDAKLDELVKALGTADWNLVAAFHGTRNGRQCRDRYKNYLAPSLRDYAWTPEEDELLIEKYSTYGSKWNKISPFFANRSDISLRNRWQLLQRKDAREERIAAKTRAKEAKFREEEAKKAKKQRRSQQQHDPTRTSGDPDTIQTIDPASFATAAGLLNRPAQNPRRTQPSSSRISDFLNQ